MNEKSTEKAKGQKKKSCTKHTQSSNKNEPKEKMKNKRIITCQYNEK